MRGCLLLGVGFLLGMILGALLLAMVQIFLIPPPAISQAGHGPPDMTILFRNDFLTRQLQQQAASIKSPVPLQDLVVGTTTNNNLVVTGNVSLKITGRTVPVQIILHPVVRDNRVTVQVIKMDVGSLTIPGEYLHGLEGPVNNQLNHWLSNTPFEIVAVSTTPEGLLVDVSIKEQ